VSDDDTKGFTVVVHEVNLDDVLCNHVAAGEEMNGMRDKALAGDCTQDDFVEMELRLLEIALAPCCVGTMIQALIGISSCRGLTAMLDQDPSGMLRRRATVAHLKHLQNYVEMLTAYAVKGMTQKDQKGEDLTALPDLWAPGDQEPS